MLTQAAISGFIHPKELLLQVNTTSSMEIFSATTVAENERVIEVGKRIKTYTGKGKDRRDRSWLSRGVKNRIIGYIHKVLLVIDTAKIVQ